MTDQLKPALGAEEWKIALHGTNRTNGDGRMFVDQESVTVNLGRQYDEVIDDQRHALAALCLYQQPFGFSQEDVRRLRMLMDQTTCETPAWAESLASRIAALLPSP